MREASVAEALKRKYPEWVVFITSSNGAGRMNVMPAGWAMITSHNPPLFAVSVAPERTTHGFIQATREFVVAFPSPGMETAIEYTGSCHGSEVDKFASGCLKTAPAKKVKAPLVEGATINLECRVVGEMEAGDHTIFVGEVLAAYIDDNAPEHLLNFGETGGYGKAVRG